ncbi:MAG: hypothetical protein JST86_10600 [Bacteroidetes bacterium]|nr:hypothetical protein [Bacteroidota bacterium]
MKEYMLLIRNEGDGKAGLSAADHLSFIQQCEVYIGKLKSKQQLIAAQPLLREGVIIEKNDDHWQEQPVSIAGTIQVGYYHILANSLDEAIQIAKENPEFSYVPSASIEVRPIKTIEQETAFVYPGAK